MKMATRCLKCMKEYQEGVSKCPHCGFVEGSEEDERCYLPPRTVLKGRYMIGCCLGSGGFGVTYIAWDSLLEKKVAIKEYLPSELATRTIGQTRVTVHDIDCVEKYEKGKRSFLDESRRLAKFNNVKGVVSIYDCFDENDTAYLVMECLEGKTLQQMINERKKIPFNEALPIFVDVLEALEVVHSEGIMHRDIAPDNIFVCDDGSAKLIDFGAARFMTTTHSRSLSMILKIGYAPIEQYTKHGNQGPWTDIYAVAASLYHAITGIVPPDSYDRVEEDKLKKPSAYARRIPNHAETAILNALNIIDTNRTQSAKQFADELKGDIDVERIREKIKHEDTGRIAKWMKYAAVGFLVAIIAFGVLFAATGGKLFRSSDYDVPDGMTRVPFILNDNISDADVKVVDKNLHMVISDRVTDNFFDNNYVLLQNPRSGNIAYNGSIVSVTASMKPDEYFVPDLSNYTKEEAVAVLEAAGFNVLFAESESDIVAPGAVISQNPPGNTIVTEGSDVTLIMNGEEERNGFISDTVVKAPNFVGSQFEDAQKAAYKKKLYLEIIKGEYSDNVPRGEILAQQPEAKRNVHEGDCIDVTVSLGKRTIIVPNLMYMKEEDAQKKIENRLLLSNVKYVSDESVEKGLVLGQVPVAGKSMYENGEITIYVSTGYDVKVPNVVGKSQEEAQAELTSSLLGYSVTFENSDTIPKGTVMAQSIAKGETVEQGTVIEITVSTGTKQVKVTGVKLNANSLTLDYGEVYTLIATISPKNATTTTVTWKSSDSSVVSVSSSGVLKAKKTGTATITVTTKDGKHTAQCKVTVVKQISTLTVSKKPSKLSYYLNDNVDYSGMVVTAGYTDGTSEDVTTKADISGFSSDRGGDKTIIVKYTYNGTTKQTSFTMHVRTLKSITVKAPSKTTYEIGESLVLDSGFSVKAKYDDGTTRDVTDVVKQKKSYDGFSSKTSGKGKVIVMYTEGATVSDSFEYTIKGDLRIDQGDKSLFNGETSTFTASYKNDSTAKTTITWSSSNTACVEITGGNTGTSCSILCKKEGKAIITAKDNYGATATVNVESKLSLVQIDQTAMTLDNTGKASLTASFSNNKNGDLTNIVWSTSNNSVVSVSGSGSKCTVTANGVCGKAEITAKDSKYGSSETITIGVYGPWQTGYNVTKDTKKYDYGEEWKEYQSRKRTCSQITTTGSSDTMSGWTKYNTTYVWSDYGGWSGWQDAAVTKSDSRDVQTQEVDNTNDPRYKTVNDYKTVYHYYRYSTARTGTNGTDISGTSYGSNYYTYDFDSELIERGAKGNIKQGYKYWHDGKYTTVFPCDTFTTREVSGSHQEFDGYGKKTQYRYRDRHQIYTYHFYKWGDWGSWSEWSDWSKTAVTEGVSNPSGSIPSQKKTQTEVNTRVVIKFRERP